MIVFNYLNAKYTSVLNCLFHTVTDNGELTLKPTFHCNINLKNVKAKHKGEKNTL